MVSKKADRNQRKQQKAARERPSLRRVWWLLILMFVLLAAFLITGGFVGFCNTMASNAILQRDLPAAKGWLRLAAQLSSDNSRSLFLQGRVARVEGNFEEMSEILRKAYFRGFDNSRLALEQDLALASTGRLDMRVEGRLNSALEMEIDVVEVLDSYANGLATISRFGDAMVLLEQWESIAPFNPIPNYRRGRIHEHLYQYDKAEAEYRKAITKDKNVVKARYALAKLLLQNRQPEQAKQLLETCKPGGHDLAVKTLIASCLRTMGDIDACRNLLNDLVEPGYEGMLESYRFVDEVPERYIAASDLGCIETEIGSFDDAKKHLELALKYHPLDTVARYSYAVALRNLGERDEAEKNFEITRRARDELNQVRVLQEAIEANPEDTDARIEIGKIILRNESERTGVFWIESVFSYDPTNEKAHAALAEYFDSKSDQQVNYLKLAEYHRSFLRTSP